MTADTDHSDIAVAEAARATWREINLALWPIIGHAGVWALFKRSLYLARVDKPALSAIYDAAVESDDFAQLHTTLAQLPGPEAKAAQAHLLTVFVGLLGSLIGESLTERLLRSVRDHAAGGPPSSSSGNAVQDT